MHDHDMNVLNRPNMTQCKSSKIVQITLKQPTLIRPRMSEPTSTNQGPGNRLRFIKPKRHIYVRGSTMKRQEPLPLYSDIMK